MVSQFGMSDKLGPMHYRTGEEHVFLGKELHESRDFSDLTARLIDEETQRLCREADERAYEILVEHRIEMQKLIDALMEHEELSREQVEELLGFKLRKSPQIGGRADDAGGRNRDGVKQRMISRRDAEAAERYRRKK